MSPRVLLLALAALLCGCAAVPPEEPPAARSACAASSMRAPGDARVQRAIGEARRQHALFGGQTIERNGGMFQVGRQEAESSALDGASIPAWREVATFWQAVSQSKPADLMTSVGWVPRREAQAGPASAAGAPSGEEVARVEALLRAAIIDTPWSAAFLSHLMKTAGFSPSEFAFSDVHADYVRAAFDASAAEAAGRPASHAFRACEAATTRPRAGDLLCATRGSTAGIVTFDALRSAMAVQPARFFPMHCDLVVRAGAEEDPAALDTVGGNVVNSVTLSRMTLDAAGVLSDDYVIGRGRQADCASPGSACRGHLSRRPWMVLLQFRH